MAFKYFMSGGFSLIIFFLAFLSIGGVKMDSLEQVGATESIAEIADKENLPQLIQAVITDKNMTFAGERVPLEIMDVRERLERELIVNAYRHSSTILAIKNANRYFPFIEKKLKENNIPDDIKYIIAAESDFQNVTSPAGARGFWQIMPAVGRSFNLEQNNHVDERYHLEKATDAAIKLLENYYRRFGNWTNAVAAYNCGETAFARNMVDQGEDNYYSMNISAETMRYIFRILAFKSILNNPTKYGYYLDKDDLYPELTNTDTIVVDSTIGNLADFAKQNGISYRQLKWHNPWMISSSLPNASKKEYHIIIPKE